MLYEYKTNYRGRLAALLFLACSLFSFKQNFAQLTTEPNAPVYTGKDLGVSYTPASTSFKVWSPDASEVRLRLYNAGDGGEATRVVELNKAGSGTWQATVQGDLQNRYYTFQTLIAGKWQLECPDMYAKAVGVNGRRGEIVDLAATDPRSWDKDKRPVQKNFTDIIIYELHVRDLSMDANSGIVHKGKFLGIAELGTKSPQGEATGLDHIKQLGVTHIHLLPCFDFNSIDETKPDAKYNWGYDPLNYNVPEGSYSTNAYDGRVRIKEFKELIHTLHTNGLRVIMDVVYNHTANVNNAVFTQFAPGYFYRHNKNGGYSNGTGCGNETASEQPMMRKFMIESVVYWAKEYHVDGFRFDLMGVHDIVTMNAISDTLHKIDPTIFIYGEGWAAGNSPMPESLRAVKKNMPQVNEVAAFSDDIRDGLRGGYSDLKSNGFVSGNAAMTESVKFGIVASTFNAQVDYSRVNYSKAPWAKEPSQAITYVSCHDDNTLFDRLKVSNPHSPEADIIKMDKLAAAVVLTSQGVAFLQAGMELLGTKQGVANSYVSPDSINQLDWSRKTTYKSVFEYYKGLVSLRKNHPAFRMPTTEMIQKNLAFVPTNDSLVIGYLLKGHANGDKWKNILVFFNGNSTPKQVNLPKGDWMVAVNGETINEVGIGAPVHDGITIEGTSAYVLFQK